jgi:16S rRNA G527 N7-methylase RsmG
MDMVTEDDLLKNQRFLRETEQAIRTANNEVIHAQVQPVTTDRMVSFARAVAKLRANYIQTAFDFADKNHAEGNEGQAEIDELNLHKDRFNSARDAYTALQRAIELGYVSVES